MKDFRTADLLHSIKNKKKKIRENVKDHEQETNLEIIEE